MIVLPCGPVNTYLGAPRQPNPAPGRVPDVSIRESSCGAGTDGRGYHSGHCSAFPIFEPGKNRLSPCSR